MSAQELAQLRGLLSQGGPEFSAEISETRAGFEAMLASFPQDETLVTSDREIGGVPGLWSDGESRGVLLYLHGGGYTFGSPTAYRQLAAGLARAGGTALFSADYRLAPEHPHPAAIEDALAVYRGLIESGVPANEIVVTGDSAGGGLALALLVAIRDAGLASPAGGVLLSPWTDLSLSGPTVVSKAAVDPSLDPDGLAASAAHYLAGASPTTPAASPLFADLAGLPPLLIEVGESEVLLSDSTRLAAAAAEIGVEVRLHVWPGMVHDWSLFAFMLSEGRDLIQEVGAFVRDRVAVTAAVAG